MNLFCSYVSVRDLPYRIIVTVFQQTGWSETRPTVTRAPPLVESFVLSVVCVLFAIVVVVYVFFVCCCCVVLPTILWNLLQSAECTTAPVEYHSRVPTAPLSAAESEQRHTRETGAEQDRSAPLFSAFSFDDVFVGWPLTGSASSSQSGLHGRLEDHPRTGVGCHTTTNNKHKQSTHTTINGSRPLLRTLLSSSFLTLTLRTLSSLCPGCLLCHHRCGGAQIGHPT